MCWRRVLTAIAVAGSAVGLYLLATLDGARGFIPAPGLHAVTPLYDRMVAGPNSVSVTL